MQRRTIPLIAINGSLEAGAHPALKLASRYADAILRAGGIPVAIPPVGGPRDVERLVASVDGVLLAGGDDFDMQRLGLGATHPAANPVPGEKQDFDFELARAVMERQLPVLGICYGMQLLALAGGGRLFQHLPEDRPGSREHAGGAVHGVFLEPSSKLARAMDVHSCDVVSRHHQAVSTLGPTWRTSAHDDEGLIEAIEHTEHPFAVGVQWHPELSHPGSEQDRLLRTFVSACGALDPQRSALSCTGKP